MLRTRVLSTGLALAVGLGGGSAALAPAALGTAARPAAVGSFHTWHDAQQAAGFRLQHPTRLHGLTRSGPIVVARCQVTGKTRKRVVFASWGHVRHRFLELSQNNSGGACGNFGEAKKLRTVRVHDDRATLFGVCGFHGAPSCHKRNIFLFLIWKRHHVYYVATSHGQWPRTLINFARSLHSVS